MRTALLLVSILLLSCQNSSHDFQGFDRETWKSDRNGCLGKRIKYVEVLDNHKSRLKGLSEDQVVSLLGRPDQNELYKRNQKFFHYWIDPAPGCLSSPASKRRLSIRFNAIGKAKEISIN